jgi:thermostable 8-oxoguanine DNA glycosylase
MQSIKDLKMETGLIRDILKEETENLSTKIQSLERWTFQTAQGQANYIQECREMINDIPAKIQKHYYFDGLPLPEKKKAKSKSRSH